MPSKYVLRDFEEQGYYHVFNQGIDQKTIFQDTRDYETFLYYLTLYTQPLKYILTKYPQLPKRLHTKTNHKYLTLISYSLLPTHFHMVLSQKSKDSISKLLKQLTNAYTLYYNQKYHRQGALFQGRYKAVAIHTDNQLLQLTRYIHLDPLTAGITTDLPTYSYSSFLEYHHNTEGLCEKKIVFSHFMSLSHYKDFTLNLKDAQERREKMKHLIIE